MRLERWKGVDHAKSKGKNNSGRRNGKSKGFVGDNEHGIQGIESWPACLGGSEWDRVLLEDMNVWGRYMCLCWFVCLYLMCRKLSWLFSVYDTISLLVYGCPFYFLNVYFLFIPNFQSNFHSSHMLPFCVFFCICLSILLSIHLFTYICSCLFYFKVFELTVLCNRSFPVLLSFNLIFWDLSIFLYVSSPFLLLVA